MSTEDKNKAKFPNLKSTPEISSIQNKIEQNLSKFINEEIRAYSLKKISPLLASCLKDFVLREGKRIRPILFISGYLGFSKKEARNLYATAVSFELLHDFFLIHDDIIDRSKLRRGKPSVHTLLNSYLSKFPSRKFKGEDLAIITGDVLYALAIKAFISIKENPLRKEKALNAFINTAVYTAAGEFIELERSIESLNKLSKEDVYSIYDYKTARYTFSSPLTCGAVLAGAKEKEIRKLYRFGISLGRAFQIKDDIIGVFSREKETGKSALTDIRQAKRTLLIWYACNNGNSGNSSLIKSVFSKAKTGYRELEEIKEVIRESGALNYSLKEIKRLCKESESILSSLEMGNKYKGILKEFLRKILKV